MASLFAENELVHEPNLALFSLEGDIMDHDLGSFLGLSVGLDKLEETLTARTELAVGLSLEAFRVDEVSLEATPLIRPKVVKKGGFRKPVEGFFVSIYRKLKQMLKWIQAQFSKIYQWVIGLFRSSAMNDVADNLGEARKAGNRSVPISLKDIYSTFRLTGIYRAFIMTTDTKYLDLKKLVGITQTVLEELPQPFLKSRGVYSEEDIRETMQDIKTAVDLTATLIVQDKAGMPEDLFAYGYQGNDHLFQKALKKRYRKGSLEVDLKELERIVIQGTNGTLYKAREERDLTKALDHAINLIKVVESGTIPNVNSEVIQMIRRYIKIIRSTIAMMQSIGKLIVRDIKSELTKLGEKK